MWTPWTAWTNWYLQHQTTQTVPICFGNGLLLFSCVVIFAREFSFSFARFREAVCVFISAWLVDDCSADSFHLWWKRGGVMIPHPLNYMRDSLVQVFRKVELVGTQPFRFHSLKRIDQRNWFQEFSVFRPTQRNEGFKNHWLGLAKKWTKCVDDDLVPSVDFASTCHNPWAPDSVPNCFTVKHGLGMFQTNVGIPFMPSGFLWLQRCNLGHHGCMLCGTGQHHSLPGRCGCQ